MAVIKGEGQASGVRGDAARRDRTSRAPITSADEQGLLFGEEPPASPDDVGYRGPTACTAAGITYRQLDYWARTGLVEPSVRPASGSGSQRLYGFRDILEALDVQLRTVNITALRNGTFFADLIFSNGKEVSARPSDSIALALRTGATIFAADEILEEAGIAIPDEQEDEVEKFREFLDTITPEDFGRAT